LPAEIVVLEGDGEIEDQ